MENQPLLNLYSVSLSKNGNYAIVTLCEGQKPNRTFRKWLIPTSAVDGKPLAVVNGKTVRIELTIKDDFKKTESKPIKRTDDIDIVEDDCPF